jgi:Xaa-Pro aminopeptidase
MKRRKDPDEIALLRRSMLAMTAGIDAARTEIKAGMTELQAFLLVQRLCNEAAGEQALVYGDFVSGPRAEKGGGQPTDRVIKKGDLVLLDYSVVLYGYRGDFANTFACQARATDEQHRLYNACRAAMTAGEALLKPGQACKDVDRAVRNAFEAVQMSQYFHSHSGHGIGLGHPDPPYIVAESSDTLLEEDVVTLEPGLFVEGVAGMRIERNYVITAKGFENMTPHVLSIDGV